MNEFCMIFTTAADAAQAQKIADAMLASRAAACVQQIPINSSYNWHGKIENASEILLQIKTRTELFGQCEKIIHKNHTYETPQIIAIPIIAGSADYLGWIKEETK